MVRSLAYCCTGREDQVAGRDVNKAGVAGAKVKDAAVGGNNSSAASAGVQFGNGDVTANRCTLSRFVSDVAVVSSGLGAVNHYDGIVGLKLNSFAGIAGCQIAGFSLENAVFCNQADSPGTAQHLRVKRDVGDSRFIDLSGTKQDVLGRCHTGRGIATGYCNRALICNNDDILSCKNTLVVCSAIYRYVAVICQ